MRSPFRVNPKSCDSSPAQVDACPGEVGALPGSVLKYQLLQEKVRLFRAFHQGKIFFEKIPFLRFFIPLFSEIF
jgi:hypothetical protein